MTTLKKARECYQDLLNRHIDSTRECLQAETEKHNATYCDRPMCRSLQPFLIDARTYSRVCETINLLARGVVAAANRLAEDEPLRRRIGFPLHLESVLKIDRDHAEFPIIGRFDGYLVDGEITCFEFNGMSGGITNSHETAAAFDTMPIAREFGRKFPFRTSPHNDLAFDAVYEDHRRRGNRGPPNICVTRFEPEIFPGSSSDWMRFVYYLASRGCRLLAASEDEYVYQDGRLYAQDTAVDLLVYSSWEEIYGLLDISPDVHAAVRDGAVRLLCGMSRVILTSNKMTFEVLSDPDFEDTFDREVAAALRKHIPWTRSLRECKTRHGANMVDLLPFVESHRDQMVIKPCGASSGAGVVLGWRVDDEQWRRVMQEGLSRHHVVQQRVVAEPQPFTVLDLDGDGVRTASNHCSVDTHVWNMAGAEGSFVRISEQQITNVGTGGTVTPIWILEDLT